MTHRKQRSQRAGGNNVRVTDVARLASVSTATVSRALNQPDLVSAETRRRVRKAISELGYVPNSAARALRSQRSRMIGTVIPTLNYAIYASFVEAVQQRIAEGGCSLLVATSELDPGRAAKQASLLIERGAEGLILVGAAHRRALYRMIEARGVPYVCTHVYRPDQPHPCVGIDNFNAMVEVVDFLHGLGHRRFGVITGETTGNDRATERIRGIRASLATHGIELPPDAITELPYSVRSGREGLRALAGLEPRPTAIICSNDVLALGALTECRDLGLAVPEEVSIVGFDNLEFTGYLNPPLTTVEYSSSDMGERAASFILDELSGHPGPPHVWIGTRLLERGTTAVAA